MADDPEEGHIRDQMAVIRTILASERTFLAYLRSSLALIATGATVIHFITNRAAVWAGKILIILGFMLLCYGALRFRSTRRAIKKEASE